jgi:hypothetical protein
MTTKQQPQQSGKPDTKALDKHAQVMNKALVELQSSLSRLGTAQARAFSCVQNKTQFKGASEDLTRAAKTLQDHAKEYAEAAKSFIVAVDKQPKAPPPSGK